MSAARGRFCWALDGHKSDPRPAVVLRVLPNDTFIVVFGYDSPHPPPFVLIEHFTVAGRVCGLTKPTHFKRVKVIRFVDITKVCGACPTKKLIELDEMFAQQCSEAEQKAVSQGTISAPVVSTSGEVSAIADVAIAAKNGTDPTT